MHTIQVMTLLLKQLKLDKEIETLLQMSEQQLEAMGYTEHGNRHRIVVARRTAQILRGWNFEQKDVELGKISAHLHDIGCAISRHNHAQNGALIVYDLLTKRGMDFVDATRVANAVGNHDEQVGFACTPLSAALIVADKSDVHFKRVRKNKLTPKGLVDFSDIHDRVNFAVVDNTLYMDHQEKTIVLNFNLNQQVSTPMEYFEIFLNRMKMCKNATKSVGWKFKLVINKQILG